MGILYYYYDEPNKGTADESRPPTTWSDRLFKGATHTATIHSHGEYLPIYDNNNFSPADKAYAENQQKPIYVTTPDGSLKTYKPITKTTTLESTNLPSDPKDPTRKNINAPVENPEPIKTIPITPKKFQLKIDILRPITPENGGIM